MNRLAFTVWVATLLVGLGCAQPPSIDVPVRCFACQSDADCGTGFVCRERQCVGPAGCPPGPLVFQLTPTRGPTGTVLTLAGFEVAKVATVAISETPALVVAGGGESLHLLVMPGTVSGPVVVTMNDGERVVVTDFEQVSVSVSPLEVSERVVASNAVGQAGYGSSVSLSADGRTLAVGAYKDTNWVGAAWVYDRDATGVWVEASQKLVDVSAQSFAKCQGFSTALDARGETLVVGGHCDDGASSTYVRQAIGVWERLGSRVEGVRGARAWEAGSVAISAPGDVLLSSVGARGPRARAFDRSSSDGWVKPGAVLFADAGSNFTASVSLSADGKTALVGGSPSPARSAMGWVFVSNGDGWVQQGDALRGIDPSDGGSAHTRVGLSGDGNTAVLMSLRPLPMRAGASAWVFQRDGGAWEQDGPRLDVTSRLRFGSEAQRFAVDFEGRRFILAGSLAMNNGVGLVQYVRTDAGWSPIDEAVTLGNGGLDVQGIGPSVAISLDGTTVAVGATADNGSRGAVYILKVP